MPGKQLSPVDHTWLRMERPDNMMMISGFMILGARMDWKRFRATIERRLLSFERFRQRIVPAASPLGLPHWQDDPAFDLDYHLQRAALPSPANQAALQQAASFLMSTQLDFTRPLWQMHLIERYGKGSALIVRLHHSMADGIALVHVLLSMTDASPNAPWPAPPIKDTHAPHAASPARITIPALHTLMEESRHVLDDPAHLRELARLGAEGALALGRLVFRSPDPPTLYKGKLGIQKQAAWSKPIPLQAVKTIGRALGGTVNDVLLTAAAGALGRYMEQRGEPAAGIRIRAVVPVNLRPLDMPPDLGNRFGVVFLTLPIGIADPVDRLHEVKHCMDELKSTPEPAVAFGLLNVMGAVPKEIQDIAVALFQSKGTAVMTNVPGPKEKLYLAGAPLESVMFWVPQSGRLGLGVSILSYAGQVWLGIATDAGLVPDPDSIVQAFHAEFAAMSKVAARRQARRGKPAKPLMSALDQSIRRVDGLIEQAEKQIAITLCAARTKAGQPCKNRAQPGSVYCRRHQIG
jgi:diacylglycerol O-acyltransferase